MMHLPCAIQFEKTPLGADFFLRWPQLDRPSGNRYTAGFDNSGVTADAPQRRVTGRAAATTSLS